VVDPVAGQGAKPIDGGDDRADVDDEDDGISQLDPRCQLAKCVEDRVADQGRMPPCMTRCSTIGPKASAGMNVRAPTMNTVPMSRPTKRGVCVANVPGLTGITFFRANEPAMARTGTTNQNLDSHMTIPPSTLWKGTFALKPANAEPLLLPMLP
jgi:hypothetical protein